MNSEEQDKWNAMVDKLEEQNKILEEIGKLIDSYTKSKTK